ARRHDDAGRPDSRLGDRQASGRREGAGGRVIAPVREEPSGSSRARFHERGFDSSAANVRNVAYERLRRSKALQRANPGQVPTGPPTSQSAAAFLIDPPGTICSACAHYSPWPMAGRSRVAHAAGVADSLIDRGEVVALLFNVSDIAVGIGTI